MQLNFDDDMPTLRVQLFRLKENLSIVFFPERLDLRNT